MNVHDKHCFNPTAQCFLFLLPLLKHMFHFIKPDLRISVHVEMSYILPTKTTPQGRLVQALGDEQQ